MAGDDIDSGDDDDGGPAQRDRGVVAVITCSEEPPQPQYVINPSGNSSETTPQRPVEIPGAVLIDGCIYADKQ